MANDTVLEVHSRDWSLADGASVAAGGSMTTTVVQMGDRDNDLAVGYHINSASGSPNVELQVSLGTDVNGNTVWHSVQSKTTAKGIFTLDYPVNQARLKVTETGGTNGLSGISSWAQTQAL